MKQRKSDILWKVVMEEVFADLLRFIFPDADKVYNMERGFEFLDKELAELDPRPDEGKDSRFADKLVKVYHRDGTEECILVHVEVQGDTSERAKFAERMYEYFYRIRDRYRKPVLAVAIFTGQDGRHIPGRYTYEYRGTKLTYEFSSLSILDYSDEELEASDNPFAQVVLAARTSLLEGKIPERDLLERKLLIANKLFKKGFSQKKIRAIFVFLENYVLFEDPEMNRIFRVRIQPQVKNNFMTIDELEKYLAKEEGIEEGLAEGIEKGREEERRLLVENLSSGTDFSAERIASLVGVTVDFVNKVRSRQMAE